MSPEPSSNKIGKSVGEKLRAARIAQHYTQSQLAAPDFSVSYISAIERGQIHPSLRALEILAGRLGLSSTQLLPTRSQQEERLASSLSITERDDDEIDFILLEAHIQIRQGVVTQAVAQLEKLSTKRLKRSQQLQHHYLLSWGYFKLAQFQECDYTLTEAIQQAKENNAHYLHLRMLNLQALAQAAMRNYAQALQAHQRCLELMETIEPRDPFFAAQVYMYMGQHYSQLENFSQALEMFNQAIAITEGIITPKDVQTTYLQMSQEYSEHKDYELAVLYSHKCIELHHQTEYEHIQSTLYYYLGQAVIKRDHEQARQFLDEALQKPAVIQDSLTHATLLTRSAEWYFGLSALDEAERAVQQACELADLNRDSIIGADALIMRGRIEYAQKHYETGDQHFTAGLEMLERSGNHEELANESVRYAELLEQAGKAREAFTYFRRAFQSQQRLGK